MKRILKITRINKYEDSKYYSRDLRCKEYIYHARLSNGKNIFLGVVEIRYPYRVHDSYNNRQKMKKKILENSTGKSVEDIKRILKKSNLLNEGEFKFI